jgi:uncharacterized protein
VGLELGDRVRVAMTKWRDRPHWEFEALWLGSDEHGDWIGLPAGTTFDRPGARFVSTNLQVGLSPPADAPEDERWWVGTFHGPGGHLRVGVYVDITTPPFWDGSTLRMVDLDLDVLRGEDGRVWIEDQDEFADHQVALGYPPEVVALAEASGDRVHRAIVDQAPPYDGSHERWLVTLTDLLTDRG